MKGKVLANRFLVAVLMLSLLVVPLAGMAAAQDNEPSLEEQIEESIANGLTWLASQQAGDGSWGEYGCDRVAATGLVVLKFETRAIELGLDPLSQEYEYYDQVSRGLTYILNNAHEQPISTQPAGDPDGNGNGKGVYFSDCSGFHQIYTTGMAMMAIAASGQHEDVLQDAVDYMAWAQADSECGPHRGGWRYVPDCNSDNSNTGYVTLGLGYAKAAGVTIPQFVKDELSTWIDVIQDDVNGDSDDGGSWYEPYNRWVNILKTGNLIYEMRLVDDPPGTQRVQDAIDYIERHWNDGGICGTGWRDHRQAMFTMMKGFEGYGIELIDLDNNGEPEHNWFEEVALHLIQTQNPDGSWPWDCWSGRILSTAWALLTLERAIPRVPVSVDVKPQSCPNPLNTKAKGVLPLAIVGTGDFDVTQVNPDSVQLEGVVPLRWDLEDVATPFEPFLGKQDAYECTEDGPDGYMDLTLKFDQQEVVAALGEVNDGDVLVLGLSGRLKDEFGAWPIVGEDVVVILEKEKE
jgi:hypothetical protein